MTVGSCPVAGPLLARGGRGVCGGGVPLGSEVNVGGGVGWGGAGGSGGGRGSRREAEVGPAPTAPTRGEQNGCSPRRGRGVWPGLASASPGLPPAEPSLPSLEVCPSRSPLCLRVFPSTLTLSYLVSFACFLGSATLDSLIR